MVVDWLRKVFESNNGKASPGKLLIFFQEVLVASLEKNEKYYVFKYHPDCPEKYKMSSIDDEGKEMNFKYLPAFFTTRIPSRARPDLAEDFAKAGDDPLKILGGLGAKSPFSPYVFKLVNTDEATV